MTDFDAGFAMNLTYAETVFKIQLKWENTRKPTKWKNCKYWSKEIHAYLLRKKGVAYSCDLCSKEKLQWGDHFRCHTCTDFDICKKCKEEGREGSGHLKEHNLLPI